MYERAQLRTMGDIIMEAAMDEMNPMEWAMSEHPERLEYVDFNDERPSIVYLQHYFDMWSERLRQYGQELAIIKRWGYEPPKRLLDIYREACEMQNYYYNLMINRANNE